MMASHNKKSTSATKGGHVSIELTASILNDKESNDRRKPMDKNVDSQTKLILSKNVRVQTKQKRCKNVGVQAEPTSTFDDENLNERQHVMSENVEINCDSSYKFDKSPVMVQMEDSNNTANNSMTKNRRVVDATTEKPRLITTNTVNDIGVDPSPITEYSKEPLLPLSKACSPLNNVLHDLSFYVQMALDETPEQPADGLTVDESAAIRLYTIEWCTPHRSLYSKLNRALKKGDRQQLRPYFKYLKLFLTALAKLPCVPPLTIWRGVTKNVSAQFSPDTTVTWWSFSSCTSELTVLENNIYLGNTGSRTLFSVEAINGRIIRDHSHFLTEDEILLLPATQMIVQSQLSLAPDLHIIHLKQIIPEEILLESPFEGILNILTHLF